MALCSHAHPVRPLVSYGDQRIPAPFLHVLGFSSTQHGPNSTEPSAASIFGASTPIFGATAPLSDASATAPDATASLEGGGRLLRCRFAIVEAPGVLIFLLLCTDPSILLAFHLIDPLNLLANSFPGPSLDSVFLQQKEICIYEMEANRCVLSQLFIFPMRSDRF